MRTGRDRDRKDAVVCYKRREERRRNILGPSTAGKSAYKTTWALVSVAEKFPRKISD